MSISETEEPNKAIRQKIRKSNVRIVITYFVVFVYSMTAVVMIFWLLQKDEKELALGVFSGLSTLSAGIAGFWFGNRGTGYPEGQQSPGGASDSFEKHFDPMLGTSRRPIDGEPKQQTAIFKGTVAKGK